MIDKCSASFIPSKTQTLDWPIEHVNNVDKIPLPVTDCFPHKMWNNVYIFF